MEIQQNLQNIPFGSLRLVILVFKSGHQSEYIIHESYIDRFVSASKSLNYDPGVNPHTKGITAKIIRVIIGKPNMAGPYWWTTPDFDFENGAAIYEFSNFHTIWEE